MQIFNFVRKAIIKNPIALVVIALVISAASNYYYIEWLRS